MTRTWRARHVINGGHAGSSPVSKIGRVRSRQDTPWRTVRRALAQPTSAAPGSGSASLARVGALHADREPPVAKRVRFTQLAAPSAELRITPRGGIVRLHVSARGRSSPEIER